MIIRLMWIEMENKEPLNRFLPVWSFILFWYWKSWQGECDLQHTFLCLCQTDTVDSFDICPLQTDSREDTVGQIIKFSTVCRASL